MCISSSFCVSLCICQLFQGSAHGKVSVFSASASASLASAPSLLPAPRAAHMGNRSCSSISGTSPWKFRASKVRATQRGSGQALGWPHTSKSLGRPSLVPAMPRHAPRTAHSLAGSKGKETTSACKAACSEHHDSLAAMPSCHGDHESKALHPPHGTSQAEALHRLRLWLCSLTFFFFLSLVCSISYFLSCLLCLQFLSSFLPSILPSKFIPRSLSFHTAY
jgi:hypothetical protein